MYEFKEAGKNTARMEFENGLKKGPFIQKSKFYLRKKERMLQNLVLQHPLCLHSERGGLKPPLIFYNVTNPKHLFPFLISGPEYRCSFPSESM